MDPDDFCKDGIAVGFAVNAEQLKRGKGLAIGQVKSGMELWFMRRLRLDGKAQKGSAKHALLTPDRADRYDEL